MNRTRSVHTLDEEYGQKGGKPVIQSQFVRQRPCQHIHTMSPVQSPILDISRTRWLLSDLKESWRRWTNAVDKMTPVPKCLPTKNNTRGSRTPRAVWAEI